MYVLEYFIDGGKQSRTIVFLKNIKNNMARLRYQTKLNSTI